MARFKLLVSLVVFAGVCTLAATGFAKPAPKPRCGFKGDYSFFFWDPSANIAGAGFFGVLMDSNSNCRSGIVLPGGIINCNFDAGITFEDFIEDGSVFLESDGEGTMEIETISRFGICGTGLNAIELDISVVQNGKTVLFNTNGVEYSSSGTIPQAGYNFTFTGRGDRCFPGAIAGCYDLRFWSGPSRLEFTQQQDAVFLDNSVGDCTVCLDNRGNVTSGECRCDVHGVDGSFEYLSEIETGGYTSGESCQSSSGYLWFTTTSDLICGLETSMALDFGVALNGSEIVGACDPMEFVLNNPAMPNVGAEFSCSFEGFME